MSHPAILAPEHADRARRAVLDHLAESLETAAGHVHELVSQGAMSEITAADARADFRQAVELSETMDQLGWPGDHPPTP